MTNPQYSPQTFIQIPPKPYFCFILTIVNLYGNYSFSEPLKTSSLPVKYFTVPVRLSLSSLFFFFFFFTPPFLFLFIFISFYHYQSFNLPLFGLLCLRVSGKKPPVYFSQIRQAQVNCLSLP